MKTLTVIATIFLPLSFIAAVYGMNFNREISRWNMPELDWRFGYPAVLIAIVVVCSALYWNFKRLKWL